jgi:hypothetical protein
MTQILPQKKSFWSLLLLTVSFCIALAAVLELVARTPWLERVSPYRSVGNFDNQFEIKWFRLQDYVKQQGGVDIIILGSSLANTGLDPDIVAQTYYQQTGVHPRIFNFGVDGMTIAPNSVIARLLVEHYHPALLIYVTEMRDYIAGNGIDYETPFLNNPWLHYQTGDFNLPGWLEDHSSALQHYLPFRNWMSPDFSGTMPIYLRRYQVTTASGYEAEQAVANNLDYPPNPNNPEDAQYYKDYGNYKIAPSRLKNLQTILNLNQEKGTSVWIVEMPVDPSFYIFVGGTGVHQQFQQTIATVTTSAGSSFLPAEACDNIPIVGRANRWHLNYMGAPIFSKCLGSQLAVLAGQQKTSFINGNSLK